MPATKALLFHFLHSLTVPRIPLAKELANYLCFNGNFSFLNKNKYMEYFHKNDSGMLNKTCKNF